MIHMWMKSHTLCLALCQDDVFRVFGGDKIETLMDLKNEGWCCVCRAREGSQKKMMN